MDVLCASKYCVAHGCVEHEQHAANDLDSVVVTTMNSRPQDDDVSLRKRKRSGCNIDEGRDSKHPRLENKEAAETTIANHHATAPFARNPRAAGCEHFVTAAIKRKRDQDDSDEAGNPPKSKYTRVSDEPRGEDVQDNLSPIQAAAKEHSMTRTETIHMQVTTSPHKSDTRTSGVAQEEDSKGKGKASDWGNGEYDSTRLPSTEPNGEERENRRGRRCKRQFLGQEIDSDLPSNSKRKDRDLDNGIFGDYSRKRARVKSDIVAGVTEGTAKSATAKTMGYAMQEQDEPAPNLPEPAPPTMSSHHHLASQSSTTRNALNDDFTIKATRQLALPSLDLALSHPKSTAAKIRSISAIKMLVQTVAGIPPKSPGKYARRKQRSQIKTTKRKPRRGVPDKYRGAGPAHAQPFDCRDGVLGNCPKDCAGRRHKENGKIGQQSRGKGGLVIGEFGREIGKGNRDQKRRRSRDR